MAHVTGQSRYQSTLFPAVPDDMVPRDHPVRVIDAFVDSLDLARLAFTKVEAEATGRPPYQPGDLSEALHLWLPESGAIEPTAGAGDGAQHRGVLAD